MGGNQNLLDFTVCKSSLIHFSFTFYKIPSKIEFFKSIQIVFKIAYKKFIPCFPFHGLTEVAYYLQNTLCMQGIFSDIPFLGKNKMFVKAFVSR